MKFDLHIHTSYSDGSDDVQTVVAKAKEAGLDGIAITDHDNVRAAVEGEKFCREAGLMFSAGIEFSSQAKEEVHILGYGLNYGSERLNEKISFLLEKRRERFYKILDKLRSLGIAVENTEIRDGECAGRVHAAKLLVSCGAVGSVNEAFDRFLAKGKPAYVAGEKLTPLEAVKEIKAAGGAAVIAHPLKLYRSGQLIPLIEGLKPYGLDGIEAYYPQHGASETAQFEHIAKIYGLIATGGSDYHGKNNNSGIGCVDYALSDRARKKIFPN